MGKPNTTFEKRAREQKKREKRLNKARKQAERARNKADGPVILELSDIVGENLASGERPESEPDGEAGENKPAEGRADADSAASPNDET